MVMRITFVSLGAALALVSFSCGSGTPPATAACQQRDSVDCDKAYSCVAAPDRNAAFVGEYGESLAACKSTMIAADCARKCTKYDATKAATCLSKLEAFSCADFLDPNVPTPVECDQACGTTQ